MKTDREFMDGVYRNGARAPRGKRDDKAAALPVEICVRRGLRRVGALCGPVARTAAGGPALQPKEQNASQARGVVAFANNPPGDASAVAGRAELILAGVVTGAGDGRLEVAVEECLKGDFTGQSLVAAWQGEMPAPAQKVLLFLEPRDGKYLLSDDGLFVQEEGAENAPYGNGEVSLSLGALKETLAQGD